MAAIKGSEGNDRFSGSSFDDLFDGRGGNDEIFGYSGNDTLIGGGGIDQIHGGFGDDIIYGYKQWETRWEPSPWDGSNDYLYGDEGNDRIFSVGGNFVDGGAGDDFIFEWSPELTFESSIFKGIYSFPTYYYDLLFPTISTKYQSYYPSIYGGSGNDNIFVGQAALIDAGSGDDIVVVDQNNSNDKVISYDGGVGYDKIILNSPFTSNLYSDKYGNFLAYAIEFNKIKNFEEMIITRSYPESSYIKLDDSLNSGIYPFIISLYTRASFGLTLYIDARAESESSYIFKQQTSESDLSYPPETMAQKMIVMSGAGNDKIFGYYLSDVLSGGDGDDKIFGGSGDDVLTGGIGNDFIDGGDDVDTAIYSGSMDQYIIKEVTYSTFTIQDRSGQDGIDTIVDVNKLQFSDQTIDVVIRGLEIIGDDTAEAISGGTDADLIDGAGGDDTLNGGAGNDKEYGGSGSDTLNGGDGNDFLNGGAGNDIVAGGAGSDTIDLTDAQGSVSVDLVSNRATGDGTDTLSSIENVVVGGGDDNVSGSAVANTLDGGAGNDVLNGGSGNDVLIGGAGNDTLIGGTGHDTANFAGGQGSVRVDLVTNKATGDGTDTLNGIENVVLGGGNDAVIGSADANTLDGGAGNDSLTGGGGNDVLVGGTGSDTLYAGDGDDTVNAGTGNDLIVGGDGAGNDTYNGGTGIDTIKYTSAKAGIRVDLSAVKDQAASIAAGDAAGIGVDQLTGIENVIAGKYADIVTGSSAANQLWGNGGNDTLNGGAGNDKLFGGAGKDTLSGGTGTDTFVFDTAPTNRDWITDFSHLEGDKIKLSKAVFTGLAYTGALHAEDFYAAAGAKSAHNATDRLIYNTTTGILYYDADGLGGSAAVQVALLGASTHPALAYSDIQIMA